jgi:hypothetical protein
VHENWYSGSVSSAMLPYAARGVYNQVPADCEYGPPTSPHGFPQ